MSFSNVLEKLGRVVFEAPFGANRLTKDAPELAELRLATIDFVKANSHKLAGKYVFPRDLIRIELLGIPEDQQTIFKGEFIKRHFTEEIKGALTRSNYRFPETLAVEFNPSSRLPEKGESWFSLEGMMQSPGAETNASQQLLTATLTVLKGTANQIRFPLKKSRTNIGRTAEVFKGAGPPRRNDVVFLDDTPAGKSVSREHAHINKSAKGEYRLFNDRNYRGEDNCGLWIVHDGISRPVHKGPRGAMLQPGDEIHIGNAAVRFSVEKH